MLITLSILLAPLVLLVLVLRLLAAAALEIPLLILKALDLVPTVALAVLTTALKLLVAVVASYVAPLP